MTRAPTREGRRPAAGAAPTDWLSERTRGRMEPGAVLLHAPSHAFQAFGGGEAQLVQTGRALEAIGVPVRPFVPWVDRVEDARLLHLFGISREGLELARVARARRVPVVLSPICWYEPIAILSLSRGPVSGAIDLLKWLVQRGIPRLPRWKRELLELSRAVLPNSVAEGRQLRTLYALDPSRIHPVPNGVDPRFSTATPDLWRATHGAAPSVLYVGRIEPRKNVLGLVSAASDLGLPLTIIGDAPPGREGYAEACRRRGDGVRWVGAIRHDDPLLASAYAAARVVALPSWFETPGLAALEGAAAGAAVVVTPYGSAREYFGERAHYARPDRPREVARALATAWRDGPAPGLAAHVNRNYLWTMVARRTAEVYDQVAG